jgi:uncharacterized membrane protein YkoI
MTPSGLGRFAGACIAITLLVAACSGDASPDEGASQGSARPRQPAENDRQVSGKGKKDKDGSVGKRTEGAIRALRAAAAAVPDGQPFDLELDDENGRSFWDVQVASQGIEHQFAVALDGSKVLSRSREPTPDDDIAKLRAARINAIRAVEIATQRQSGQLSKVDIGTDLGSVVWEVDLARLDGSEVKMDINARSGKVLRVERDLD